MSEPLLVDIQWGVARLTLNRPDQRNSLNAALIDALSANFHRLKHDDTARVIELTGAGEKVFSAGGDLSGSGIMSGEGVLAAHYARSNFADLLRAMQQVGKPIVGVIQGHALGGGFGLAMACDLLVVAEDVNFGTPEINVGLFPMIIMAVLRQYVPQRKLLEMMMTGEKLSATEALRLNLVNTVVPRSQLRSSADQLIQQLLRKSPAALRLGRDAFYRMSGLPFDAALDFLNSQLTLNLLTEDAIEGVSAFIQKRDPEWKGR